ncbi:hypothetical protein ACE1CD_01760 [Aerosakkonema sp. BLCC-F183]|uniref:hypothetical protein n=1 Tax=Aerosakkonema sp. BLCC-F183 TaxID=3342834 RepID=UPI0035B9353F
MKKQPSNPDQLSFSIGRPLPVLLEEVQKSSRNRQLRKAAEQMIEALRVFELANETGLSKSVRAKVAIHEILTK